MARDTKTSICGRCEGQGKVADTSGEPWPKAAIAAGRAAVVLGLLKPVPCPDCKGRGVIVTKRRENP